MLRAFVLLSATSLWLGVLAACPTGTCECFVCVPNQAVTMSVLDEDGTPLTDWLMDATVDGAVVDDIGSCDPANRATNTCSFGSDLGVYHVVVRAPGFVDKELSVRSAAASGQNCCGSGPPCVANTLVSVFMIPEQP